MDAIANLIRSAPLAFLRWWLAELGSFLPAWLTSGRDRPRKALILDVDQRGAMLTARKSKSTKVLGQITSDADGTGLSALGERRYRRWPLIVRLASDLGMRKVIDLPLQARNDLGNLLHFELDQLTPFSPEDVSFAWRVLETNPATGRMTVALQMAPKALVERNFKIAAEHGRTVERVEIEDGDDQDPIDLLSSADKVDPGSRFGYVLPLMVVALAVMALWIPMSRQQSTVDQLAKEVETLRVAAEETRSLKQEIDASAREAGFLVDAKNGQASMTRVLAELTRLIPDHSHIIQLEINDDSIQIGGFSEKARDLLAILDRSAMFTSPASTSATTRDPRMEKERFQITVQLEGEAF